jgi:hypothetical protein
MSNKIRQYTSEEVQYMMNPFVEFIIKGNLLYMITKQLDYSSIYIYEARDQDILDEIKDDITNDIDYLVSYIPDIVGTHLNELNCELIFNKDSLTGDPFTELKNKYSL